MKTVVDLYLNEIGHGNIVVNALVAVVFPQRGDNLRISECLAESKDLGIALAEDAIASVAAIEVAYEFAACVLAPSYTTTILHEILSLERVAARSEFGVSRVHPKPAILDTKLCVYIALLICVGECAHPVTGEGHRLREILFQGPVPIWDRHRAGLQEGGTSLYGGHLKAILDLDKEFSVPGQEGFWVAMGFVVLFFRGGVHLRNVHPHAAPLHLVDRLCKHVKLRIREVVHLFAMAHAAGALPCARDAGAALTATGERWWRHLSFVVVSASIAMTGRIAVVWWWRRWR